MVRCHGFKVMLLSAILLDLSMMIHYKISIIGPCSVVDVAIEYCRDEDLRVSMSAKYITIKVYHE